MAQYTSILLPLARWRRKLLERAAQARGETLESFILSAAEAEAGRLGDWLTEKGHRVDQPIHDAAEVDEVAICDPRPHGDSHVELQRVASTLGWDAGAADWHDEVEYLIETVDALDRSAEPPSFGREGATGSRRGRRQPVFDLDLLNPVHGRVLDISSHGIGIETYRPFSVPERTLFSIGRSTCAAKIRAEVRWCSLIRTERIQNGDVVPVYRAGLAFVGQ